MPELPEVERFRQILLPLVTVQKTHLLSLELHGEKPPRKWVSAEEVNSNTGKWCCTDVLRKGKLLCMVLEMSKETTTGRSNISKEEAYPKKYFYLHMGMTGRLASTTKSCSWGHKYISEDPTEEWPPKYTYLILTSGEEKVAFADPRKFGSCKFSDSLEESFGELAPDGFTETTTPLQCKMLATVIANQRLGIKALILDQKRVISGVGNWVADEILYQCEIHPDQSYLTYEQAFDVVEKLHSILSIAVECLNLDIPYPENWLFGFRWTKKKAGKDCKGRSLTFLQSGGRTSAIVASIQKLYKSQGQQTKVTADTNDEKKETKRTLDRVRKKPSGAVKAALTEEEATTADPIPDVVLSKKRRVITKVKQEVSKRRKRGSRTTCTSTTPEERTPGNLSFLSSTISLSSPKESRNTLPKKLIVKESKRKGKGKKLIKQDEVERCNDDSCCTSSADFEEINDVNFIGLRKEMARKSTCEKDEMLKGVDKSHFREVGFAKWQRNWLPVIQVGPYDISPGPVRNEWMKIFHKTNKAPRLVYWYGSTKDDLSSAFSFLNQSAIITYDEGIKLSHDKFSSKLQKKITAGKRLTITENALVNGLTELKDEAELPKEDRLVWIKTKDTIIVQ